jgi:hypothetical protein
MTMSLDPEALATLTSAAASPSRGIALDVLTRPVPSALERRLVETARELEHATAGAVPVVIEPADHDAPAPVLAVRAGGRVVASYQAVPEGPEEGPFLELLLALAGAGGASPPGACTLPPTVLEVFIAAGCPNCPTAVRAALALAAACPELAVAVIDVAERPDRARDIGVRSVPTIVASGGMTIVGAISARELASTLAASHGPDGAASRLGSQLEAGRFAAAGELLASGHGRETFLERWRGGGLERRMGLTLAADEALQRDPAALDALVPGLLPLLGSDDTGRRGDTVELLGRIGHPTARPALEAMRADADEDVAEAAIEALLGLDARARAGAAGEPAG